MLAGWIAIATMLTATSLSQFQQIAYPVNLWIFIQFPTTPSPSAGGGRSASSNGR